MIILGLNAYHGDAAACLIKDGEVVAACEEERFRRIKHCAGFPSSAIRACLNQMGISIDDVDAIAISKNPKANLSKKLLYAVRRGIASAGLIKKRLDMTARMVHVKEELTRTLQLPQVPQAKIYPIEHHLAHLASCFFPSPFEQAAVLSLDGFGDFVSAKWGYGEGTALTLLGQVEFPHSVGILYTTLTQYLGFPNYGDEYKVMALASYGEPHYQSDFQEIIKTDSKNGFQLNLDYFVHHLNGVEMNWKDGSPRVSNCFSQEFIERFGPSRLPEEPITSRHQDLAASLQQTFEEVYFYLLNELYKQTRLKNLCVAGGCAFNSVANGKIRERTPYERVFIQPAAGDAGTALGAALYFCHVTLKKPRRFQMHHVYLGPSFEPDTIEKTLELNHLPYRKLSDDDIASKAAQSLAEGKIVGWFQGRMEFGPRALGNRSLLADPRLNEMKDILNQRIKHRESFRPFAPSILAEELDRYFEGADPDPFMTQVYRIKKEKQRLISAVSHIDGTGRIQAVDRQNNPKYWKLIRKFKELTGVPVVLNTSFNENEPIVCTPEEAIHCFNKNKIDCLAIGDFWIERNQADKRQGSGGPS